MFRRTENIRKATNGFGWTARAQPWESLQVIRGCRRMFACQAAGNPLRGKGWRLSSNRRVANANRDVRAPLSGSIVEINRDLESNPELVRKDPYGAGWLFRLKIEAGEEIEHLLSSTVYRERLHAAEAMDVDSP